MPLAAQSFINKIFMLRLNLYSGTLWDPPSALGTPRYRGHLLNLEYVTFQGGQVELAPSLV